ncbi:transmembrane protein 81 isoform X2 [Oryzias latipes]|uniref:Transmembrane protein 81 n=2 Tax=Oryzias latipes TaxID=8090 RepID=A0A3B3HRH2_ORYLA|nr:transmembrane protein 81 isoform X2 [Oryzias latipes]XP_020557261.1 transmembrane protein 81 isoform X2 [Oryzias latipes]
MQCSLMKLCLLLLLFHPPVSAGPDEAEKVVLEVITDSSPCSTTCGLGIRTQTLCLLKDSKTALEEKVGRKNGTKDASQTKVSEECRVRKVNCLELWQCGLQTMTVTTGQRVEIDCLGEVMEAMGRFSWRVSWRYARGIITSDDSLFERWTAPLLDRMVLDPVKEENAGTYRCDVQDTNFRRVKRIYWGIRVLPVGVVNLDYESALARWKQDENQQKELQTVTQAVLLYAVGISLSLATACTGLVSLYRTLKTRCSNK